MARRYVVRSFFTPSGHHDRWPTFARGDCGHSNEKIRVDLEERELLYLLRLKHTSKIKALEHDLMHPSEGWLTVGTDGKLPKPRHAFLSHELCFCLALA